MSDTTPTPVPPAVTRTITPYALDEVLEAVAAEKGLTFGGALNSAAWFKAPASKRQWRRARGAAKAATVADGESVRMIDPEAVAHLNAIIERGGPVGVVVSSSWRKAYTLAEIRFALRERGFNGQIIGKTPSSVAPVPGSTLVAALERGHEIAAWLAAHPAVKSFVILDDCSDMAHLLPYLVQTPFATGLTAAHVPLAVALLRANAPECAA